ncbi:hypothetical protein [Bradyrhizobium sp. CCBAU 53380]|uniref:hypothetical protein n=1 Tax=Bradyrhizobium sp. CCBAU 53380 TaxID=1325117 RepID=UPI0023031CDA|nr:hypothetical protein [Bradyrhizobium sp. CCBAU 53380]
MLFYWREAERPIGPEASDVPCEAEDLAPVSPLDTKVALEGASDPLNVSIEDDIAGRLQFEMDCGLARRIRSVSLDQRGEIQLAIHVHHHTVLAESGFQ